MKFREEEAHVKMMAMRQLSDAVCTQEQKMMAKCLYSEVPPILRNNQSHIELHSNHWPQ